MGVVLHTDLSAIRSPPGVTAEYDRSDGRLVGITIASGINRRIDKSADHI
jgi:hypothetical protein